VVQHKKCTEFDCLAYSWYEPVRRLLACCRGTHERHAAWLHTIAFGAPHASQSELGAPRIAFRALITAVRVLIIPIRVLIIPIKVLIIPIKGTDNPNKGTDNPN
jgi:hypothetical protein